MIHFLCCWFGYRPVDRDYNDLTNDRYEICAIYRTSDVLIVNNTMTR